MWRLRVLAAHLRWYGLYELGLAMVDGSYWRDDAQSLEWLTSRWRERDGGEM